MEFFTDAARQRDPAVGAIIVGALVAGWLARIFVHGIVKALLDREATEGTAQELSAVELRKRMDTLDGLGAHVIQAFIVVIAALMVIGELSFVWRRTWQGVAMVGVAVGLRTQAFVRATSTGT